MSGRRHGDETVWFQVREDVRQVNAHCALSGKNSEDCFIPIMTSLNWHSNGF